MLRASQIEIDRLAIKIGKFTVVETWADFTCDGDEHVQGSYQLPQARGTAFPMNVARSAFNCASDG